MALLNITTQYKIIRSHKKTELSMILLGRAYLFMGGDWCIILAGVFPPALIQ